MFVSLKVCLHIQIDVSTMFTIAHVTESFSTLFRFCFSVSVPEATPLKLESGALLKPSIKQLWGAAFLKMQAPDEVCLTAHKPLIC